MNPVEYRLKHLREPHRSILIALATNAGIRDVLGCYPTWLGYEIYAKDLIISVDRVGRDIPGYLGCRVDERGYVTAVVHCRHPGREML